MANIFRRIGGAIKNKFTPKSRPITEPRRRPVPQVRSVQIKPVQRMSVADMTKRMAKDVGGTAYTQKRNTSTPLATGRATQQRRTSVLATPIKTTQPQPQPIIIRRSPDKFIQELIIRGTLRPDGSRDVLKIAEEKAKEKIEQQRIASSTSRPGSGWRDKRGTVYQNKKGVQDYWERNYRDIYNQSGIPLRSGNISARGFYDKGVVTMSKNIYPSEQEYREVALHEFGHAKTLERKKSTVLQETISGGLKEYMKEKKFVTDIRRKTGAFPQKIFYSNKVDNAILDKTAPPRDDSIFNSSYIKRHGYTSDQIPREIAANLYSKAVYGDNLGIKLPGFVSKPGINYSAQDREWVQNKVYTDIGLQKVNVKKDLTVQPVPSQRKRNISFFDINIKNKIW